MMVLLLHKAGKKRRDVCLSEIPGTSAFDTAYKDAVTAVETGRKPRSRPRKTGVNPDGVRGAFPACIDRVLKQTGMRAASLKRDFDIDHEWMVRKLEEQDYRCALTYLPFSSVGGNRNPFAPSVDRIDSRRGYSRDNVRLVLLSVNLALNDFGREHFDMMCAARIAAISGRLP